MAETSTLRKRVQESKLTYADMSRKRHNSEESLEGLREELHLDEETLAKKDKLAMLLDVELEKTSIQLASAYHSTQR